MGIGDIELRLHGIAPEGIAGLELLIEFDGALVGSRVELGGRLGIELGGAPPLGFIDFFAEDPASGERYGEQERGQSC